MTLASSISAVITGGASGLGAVFCKVDVTDEEQMDAGFAKAAALIG